MAISFDKALGVYESALSLRSERAGVLANNLSNVNTPGYKAQDIDFKQALKDSMGQGIGGKMATTTHAAHIGAAENNRFSGERLYRTPAQPSINGNTVEEQKEHAEYMKNTLEFQAAFTVLNSKFKGLTKAIRGE